MARNKPPSFDFYPDDFIAGTLSMHPTAKGIYITLLCHQWSHGAIPAPASKRQLVQITGAMPDELDQHIPEVFGKFTKRDDGLYINERLHREFERKMEVREKRQQAGMRGGRPKKEPPNGKSNCLTKSKAKQEAGSRKQEDKKNKSSAFDPSRVELPFGSGAFAEAWASWVRHRDEIRKPLTIQSTAQQLREFAEWGEERSVAAIRHTIAKGWQGLREPDPAATVARPQTFAQQRIANTATAAKEFLEDDRIR